KNLSQFLFTALLLACAGTQAQSPSAITCTPAMPGAITGPSNACGGYTVTYSISPVSGATAYAWTLPAGWSGTSNTNSITATTSSASGNVSVVATNSCGTSPVQTKSTSVDYISTTVSVTPICCFGN